MVELENMPFALSDVTAVILDTDFERTETGARRVYFVAIHGRANGSPVTHTPSTRMNWTEARRVRREIADMVCVAYRLVKGVDAYVRFS